jgi:hypothetical protein
LAKVEAKVEETLDKQRIINLLIVFRVYLERTIPLLKRGTALLTDRLPKQDDGNLLISEINEAIKELKK